MTSQQIEGTGYKTEISRKSERINSFLVKLSILIAIVPDLNRYFPKSIWIIIILSWYMHVLFFTNRNTYQKRGKVSLFTFILLVGFFLEIFLRVIGYSTAGIGNYFIKLGFVDFLIKGTYVYRYYSEKEKHRIFRFIQVLILLLIIQNIYIGITVPSVHYYMYFSPERFIGMNVAMTEFYNVVSFFIGISLSEFIYQEKLRIKIIDMACIALGFYFLFSFEPRTTAIALAFLFVSLTLIKASRNTTNRIMFIIAMVFLLLFIAVFARDTIMRLLPERISERLNAVFQLTNAQLDDSDYYGRFRLFFTSLNTFFSSPKTFLIGVGYHLGDAYKGLIGQHSFVADTLAAYGCVGAAFMIYTYRKLREILTVDGTIEPSNACRRSCLQVLFVAAFLSTIAHPESAVVAIMFPACFITHFDKNA